MVHPENTGSLDPPSCVSMVPSKRTSLNIPHVLIEPSPAIKPSDVSDEKLNLDQDESVFN